MESNTILIDNKHQDKEQGLRDSQNISKVKQKPYPIIILSISIILFITVASLILYYHIQNQQKIDFLATPNPPSPTLTQPEKFPIEIRGLSTDNYLHEVTEGAPCQPEIFDPKVDEFYKVKQNGVPTELYKIKGFEDDVDGGVMMIDGWYKEGEEKTILPTPFNVIVYNFGCASSFSSAIDLHKNNTRQALYTHVLSHSFSKDGKYLYLVNLVNNNGQRTQHERIIDIESNEIYDLPNLKCVSKLDGFWQGERLITYSEDEGTYYSTDICIFDKSANLLSRIGAATYWGAANRSYLAEKIGLLPNDPDIFYAYTSKDSNTCSLLLADTNSNQIKSIDILDKRDYPDGLNCVAPNVEFDFSELSFNQGTLKYRVEKERLSSGEVLWGDWVETQ